MGGVPGAAQSINPDELGEFVRCQSVTCRRHAFAQCRRSPSAAELMYRFFSVAEEAVSGAASATVSAHSNYRNASTPLLPSPEMLDSVQLRVPAPPTNGAAIFGVGVGILNGQNEETEQQQQRKRMSIFARQKSSSEEADRKKRLTMPLIYRMYESQSEDFCGSVRGPDDDDFHPEEASKSLRQALAAGIQSHDKTLIDVLLAHNNFQRQKIATAYENMYARSLADDVEEESGGHFMESILALLLPAHVYSARTLFFAISGKSFERSAAVEVGLTSTASQLGVIRDTYQNEFRVLLERDLSIKVEGLFGKMLAQLLLRKTDFADDLDVEEARREADVLFKEGNVEELGRSLELFNRVFGLRSPRQIQAFVERYDTLARDAQNRSENELASGRTESRTVRNFEWTIRKSVNIHSDIKQAILLYARISKNMQLYFAEKLHEAVSQARPDHQTIIRVAVSRSEIDLYDICNEYRRKYGHHLVYDLQNMCSGDFLRLLSRLVNPPDVASGDEMFSAV